jgi:hypothetical protein
MLEKLGLLVFDRAFELSLWERTSGFGHGGDILLAARAIIEARFIIINRNAT